MSLKKEEMSKQKITLGLSLHRPETVPFLADWMKQHDAVVLEEPPDEGFEQMLQGTLAVDDYIVHYTDKPNVANVRVSCVRAAVDYSPADDNFRTPDAPYNACRTREVCL